LFSKNVNLVNSFFLFNSGSGPGERREEGEMLEEIKDLNSIEK
jgi:hypothetical protein